MLLVCFSLIFLLLSHTLLDLTLKSSSSSNDSIESFSSSPTPTPFRNVNPYSQPPAKKRKLTHEKSWGVVQHRYPSSIPHYFPKLPTTKDFFSRHPHISDTGKSWLEEQSSQYSSIFSAPVKFVFFFISFFFYLILLLGVPFFLFLTPHLANLHQNKNVPFFTMLVLISFL